MTHLRKTFAALLLGTLAIGVTAGCMSETTAPDTRAEAQTVQSSRGAQQNSLLGGLVGGLVSTVDKLLFTAVDVVGDVGGTVSNGRWRVDVPAGAIDGNATVSVGVVSTASQAVQLDILPLDKNHFATPVRVTCDCSGISSILLKTYVINWYNPATRTWVPVAGSTVDLTNKTVSAPLEHFSAYSCGPAGKAGW